MVKVKGRHPRGHRPLNYCAAGAGVSVATGGVSAGAGVTAGAAVGVSTVGVAVTGATVSGSGVSTTTSGDSGPSIVGVRSIADGATDGAFAVSPTFTPGVLPKYLKNCESGDSTMVVPFAPSAARY